jgi:hypothetical protein
MVRLLVPFALLGAASAQQAISLGDDISANPTGKEWTEAKGTKTEDGESTGQPASLEKVAIATFSPAEQETEQAEITEYGKKNKEIFDPNMYPYGPIHGDYRAPGADDAVSDTINLPYPFPFFNGQSTSKIRASTNGMIVLDDKQVFENNPSELPSVAIDVPFVAGFWNDIWSKKQGKIYWRLEQTNTTLLSEMRDNIIEGFPELANIGEIQYAFIFSFWRVTHYGARKNNGIKQNTFQITLATTGKYSFLINNYQKIEWNIALGTAGKAVGGFDIDNAYYTMMEGSLDDGNLNWAKTSTNSNMPGRHIFRLDDLPPPDADEDDGPSPTNDPATAGTVMAENIWPANDNTLGGGIFKYVPREQIANGTCTIQFPSEVAWFHVFNGHIRADAAVTSMVWKIVAANPTFEPNQEDGSFQFAIQFNRGFEFTADDISMSCITEDEFNFAVYSFPQNHLQEDARSNIRKKDNAWDPTASYALTFASAVANFTVDDPRIQVATADNMNFILTEVPPTIEEVWFQFSYINYFGSNEVGVVSN